MASLPDGRVLLDTPEVSAVIWGKPGHEPLSEAIRGRVAAISFATVAELRHGGLKRDWGDVRMRHLDRLLEPFLVLPFADEVASHWAAIARRFAGQLKGGGVNDMWTAACALAARPEPLTIVAADRDLHQIGKEFPLEVVHPDDL